MECSHVTIFCLQGVLIDIHEDQSLSYFERENA